MISRTSFLASFSAVYTYFVKVRADIFIQLLLIDEKKHTYQMLHITADRLTACAYVVVTFSEKKQQTKF